MSICERLRISETFFDGYALPETIEDTLIFFSTEIEDQNNIPEHINKLLIFKRLNPGMTDEELIKESDCIWFTDNVSFYLQSAIQNENSKIETFYSIFEFCIENYDIYQREVFKRFRNINQNKINEVLTDIVKKHYFNFNKNHACYPVYEKCHQLQDLHIRDQLVDESLITNRRGEEMMG
jgi:hypothetical protein